MLHCSDLNVEKFKINDNVRRKNTLILYCFKGCALEIVLEKENTNQKKTTFS